MFNQFLFSLSIIFAITSLISIPMFLIGLWKSDKKEATTTYYRDTFVMPVEKSIGINTEPTNFVTFEFHSSGKVFYRFVEEALYEERLTMAMLWAAKSPDRWFKVTTHDGLTRSHGQKSSLLAFAPKEESNSIAAICSRVSDDVFKAVHASVKAKNKWVSVSRYRVGQAMKYVVEENTPCPVEFQTLVSEIRVAMLWRSKGAMLCGANGDKYFNRR